MISTIRNYERLRVAQHQQIARAIDGRFIVVRVFEDSAYPPLIERDERGEVKFYDTALEAREEILAYQKRFDAMHKPQFRVFAA